MAEQNKDPFQNFERRHVMPEGMSLLDMEEQASLAALEKAGCERTGIDLLLTNRSVPEFLLSNPAAGLHERLGLSRECLSTHLDVATHSFLMQLALAEGMIAAGRARYALLVQSVASSRLIDPTQRISPHFGDIATAVIIGPTSAERGIKATVNYTDGRYPKTLIASLPGVRLQIGEPAQLQAVFLGAVDACVGSIRTVISRAKWSPERVEFLAIHQGAPWLRRIVQEESGLTHTRSAETFKETGYVFASNIPASLAKALERGDLREGDPVVLVGGGPGQTYGATALVWGA
jgi:3-oxoacyl-[acyl-carrier-protein] synthase-3